MADAGIDLLRSSLDLLILKALSWGPKHGYAVAEWIEYATGDAFALEEGTLYPALHRLERKGWVRSEWGTSDNNRRARYYRPTAAGRAQLRAGAPAWHRYAEAIAVALRATSPDVAGA
jgi:transcriptional regulator